MIPVQNRSYTRVQNDNTENTVKTDGGVVFRIISTDGAAAGGTVTVADGVSTVTVLEVPTSGTLVVDFECLFASDIRVTNSVVALDTVVVYA